ncbi:hypothetical protein LWI29_029651 [Acer saccharum]|uniref:C-JID domain-containing protein n=1 Tax=Acer saccharum TaxID=4024 RepID=A0AA39RFK4_ACESA|nr:hypothetical protein LWI29_029651 [Acer saccharum]
MHDLLQDLGRYIVDKESSQRPGNSQRPGERSRLWRQEDVQDILKHGAGTDAVVGIFLDMSKINVMHLSLKAFNKMYNLRLLKFYNSNKRNNKMYDVWLRECYHTTDAQSVNKVRFRKGQNDALPFGKLRSFIWFGYPFAALSSKFNPENLVELNLSCSSNLKRLWGDTKHAPKLKWLDLHDCPSLIEVPDLSKSPSLKKIDLRGCSHLTKIQNLSNLGSLEVIDLHGCSCLTEIPDLSGSPSLTMIDLEGCKSLLELPLLASSWPSDLNIRGLESLTSFPSTVVLRYEHLGSLDLSGCKISEEMEGLEILDLRGTAIKELPHSIKHLTKLSKLSLSRCKNLESLPCNLISLKYLDISDCSKLEKLPENFGNLKSLEDLSMDRIAISQLPSTMMHLNEIVTISCRGCRYLRFTDLLGLPRSLTSLDFSDCNLNKIPEDIGCLSSLEVLELSGNSFESLPKSMKHLDMLRTLKVDNCTMLRSLTDLPSALRHLSASGCKELRSIPDASEFAKFYAQFIFTNCLKLKTAVGDMLATLKEGYEKGDEIYELTFCCPGSKVPEWFRYRTKESSIEECCELNFEMPWHDGSNDRPLLGFVVCTVIAFNKYCCIKDDSKYLRIDYKYTGSDGNESSLSQRHIEFGVGNEILIDSDHIAYPFRFFKISDPRISKSGISNWSFKFWFLGHEKNSKYRIKSFGLCPIYAKPRPGTVPVPVPVTSVKVSLSSAGQNQRVDSVMGKPLKEQAFATPDKVAELVQKVNTAIQQVLPPVMAKMKLYLQNPSTPTILFKPVKTNIVEAHIQVQSLLKSEYSPKEQSLTGSECTTRQSL